MIIEPHSDKQELAMFSEHPITVCATGIQYGKTTVGSTRLKIKMHEYTSKDDNFLLLAPNYKIMQQSSLPAFLKLMDRYGKYNESKAQLKMYNGGTCWMRTATDPDSIVGITNVRHIWGDEAGLFPLYFWENIQARASFRQAQIDLTTSPYTLNWIYKELIRGVKSGTRPDVLLIQAASNENPYFPQAEFERKRSTMDPRRFRMIYGGQFERMEGLVYDAFDEKYNICDWPEQTPGSRYFGGIDWGYTEPFALVVHMISRKDEKTFNRYQVSETKKARLTLDDIITVCRQKMQVFGVEHFFADPSQPGHIEALNRAGIPCSAAKNDIKTGIDTVYHEIKSRRFQLVRDTSPHTIDEFETYHYPEPHDLKPDQSTPKNSENPVGQNDHCSDAIRYCVVSTQDFMGVRQPVIGGTFQPQTNYHRIQQLMKKTG